MPEEQPSGGQEEAVFKRGPSEGADEGRAEAPADDTSKDEASKGKAPEDEVSQGEGWTGGARGEPVSATGQRQEQEAGTTGPARPELSTRELRREARARRRRAPSFFWPIVLIGAGVLLLLSNLGYISSSTWNVLLQLWPVLLIAFGIELLFGRRSMVGALISGLLILVLLGAVVAAVFISPQIPALSGLVEAPAWRTEQVEYPLGSIQQATVNIDWSSLPGTVRALQSSSSLVQGEIAYRGNLVFDVRVRDNQADVEIGQRFTGAWFGPFDVLRGGDHRWVLGLNPNVGLDLRVNGGSGPCTLDLWGLQLDTLNVDVGSGPIDLSLPAGDTFNATIVGGSGPLTILVPSGTGVRAVLDSGSGPFHPGEQFALVSGEQRGDGVWESADWQTAKQQIELRIDQGSGPVTIR
jgi:hypothetical protein